MSEVGFCWWGGSTHLKGQGSGGPGVGHVELGALCRGVVPFQLGEAGHEAGPHPRHPRAGDRAGGRSRGSPGTEGAAPPGPLPSLPAGVGVVSELSPRSSSCSSSSSSSSSHRPLLAVGQWDGGGGGLIVPPPLHVGAVPRGGGGVLVQTLDVLCPHVDARVHLVRGRGAGLGLGLGGRARFGVGGAWVRGVPPGMKG